MKDTENLIACIAKSRNLNAQRRGEDALLREKVRRDYQALMRNLHHLAQEERKLKASQVQSKAVSIINLSNVSINRMLIYHKALIINNLILIRLLDIMKTIRRYFT